ncbi:MAG: DMT family transporter [Candidatus Odinarchaeota archaeon]
MPVQEYKQFYILLFITMTLWGISWPITKVLVSLAPPMTVGFFRFLIATLLFIPVTLYTKASFRLNKQRITGFLSLGLTGIFGYGILFLIGMKFTTAAQGSIIAGINPASVSLFAHIIHGERLPDRWRYWGFPLSFIGVIFVIGVQSLIDFQPEYLLGNIIILIAMAFWGLYSSLGKKFMETNTSLEATTGAVFIGMLLFGLGAIWEQFWVLDALINPVFWIGIFILGGFTTFLGFLFYFYAVKNIGATKSGIFINLVPVLGTLFSAILLQEAIYWTFIVGLILIIAGIFLINYPSSNTGTPKLLPD